MSTDTMKSLGYLKKSLKMSKKAVTKNMGNDNTSSDEVDEFTSACDELLSLIESWEKNQAPAHTINFPAATVFATPATPPVPTVGGLTVDPV
jgi:hypothetical protein